MAKNTPESKVKSEVLKVLDSLGERCFYYMPVQNGMGNSGIPDIMATIGGVTVAIECKATPKQEPTILQAMQLEKIHLANGVAWVVDNENISDFKVLIGMFEDGGEWYDDAAVETMDEVMSQGITLYRWTKKLEVVELNGDSD